MLFKYYIIILGGIGPDPDPCLLGFSRGVRNQAKHAKVKLKCSHLVTYLSTTLAQQQFPIYSIADFQIKTPTNINVKLFSANFCLFLLLMMSFGSNPTKGGRQIIFVNQT